MADNENILHLVSQGEWLNAIARQYGVRNPDRIWNDPNNAQLAGLRDPNILYPGDWIYIPAPTPKKQTCASGQRHTFAVKSLYDRFEVTLQDPNGQPYANVPYRLAIGPYELNGTTDGQGVVKAEKLVLPAGATGVLELPTVYLRYPLSIGALNPINKAAPADKPTYDNGFSGVLMRLRNLGYYDGPVPESTDDAIDLSQHGDPITRFQVIEMQRDPDKADGELDDATRSAIKDQSLA